MNRIRISVLLPVFNGEMTISSAIRSTLRSLPDDSELIILDDCSTDTTLELLAAIHDDRIRISSSTVNLGVAATLNRGLQLARGSFVARMDADDISLPWRFRRQLSRLESTDSDFVFSTYIRFGGLGLPKASRFQTLTSSAAPILLCAENYLAHPTMLARREALDQLGPYQDSAAEDYVYWIRASLAGSRILRDGLPGILYRDHPDQVSKSARYFERLRDDPILAQALTDLAAQVGLPHPEVLASISARVETPDHHRMRVANLRRLAMLSRSLPAAERRFILHRIQIVAQEAASLH